jgi:hypothetical protein
MDEAIDIAVSSVVSYLQAHNLNLEVWFMCYDNETLLKYRTKNTEGVGDVSTYFERKEIKIDAKLNNEEKAILKKKMFKKEISKEQELNAVNAVLKRIIKKKYPDCVYLAAPKKKSDITMKTCDKYECSGPFVTMDCVEEYSYDKDRMRIRLTPYCFVDTPDELESKKKYFSEENDEGVQNGFVSENRSYEQANKTIKVLNIESLLSNIENNTKAEAEYVDIDKSSVQIADMEDANDEMKKLRGETQDTIEMETLESGDDVKQDELVDNTTNEPSDTTETPYLNEPPQFKKKNKHKK